MPTFDETIRAIAQQEMPDDQHHLIDTYQESTYFWANQNLSMMRKWIIGVGMMLAKPLEDTDVGKFYINLHGIVDEMHEHLAKRLDTLKEVFEVADLDRLVEGIRSLQGDAGMRRYLELSVIAFRDLDSIRNDYSDFELKQIMFFRHQHCHPMLTKLSVKITRKKRFTGVEVDRLMREVAGTDELEAMTSFHPRLLARRDIIKHLDETLRSMQFN